MIHFRSDKLPVLFLFIHVLHEFSNQKSSKIKIFGMTALTKKIKVRPEKFYRSDTMR